MSAYYRKSVYMCRAPWCKHVNIVFEKLDADENVVEIALAWQHRCGKCGGGSLDLIYQKVLKPEEP